MIYTHFGSGWFPTTLPLFLLLIFPYYKYLIRGKSTSEKVLRCLLFIYLFVLTDLTQAPFPYNYQALEHIAHFHQFRYNIVPLNSFHQMQFFLNIILFIPFGILVPLNLKDFKFSHIIFIGFICSLGIEIFQLFTSALYLNVRSFDVDDIITNTLGTLVGYVILILLRKIYLKTKKKQI